MLVAPTPTFLSLAFNFGVLLFHGNDPDFITTERNLQPSCFSRGPRYFPTYDSSPSHVPRYFSSSSHDPYCLFRPWFLSVYGACFFELCFSSSHGSNFFSGHSFRSPNGSNLFLCSNFHSQIRFFSSHLPTSIQKTFPITSLLSPSFRTSF